MHLRRRVPSDSPQRQTRPSAAFAFGRIETVRFGVYYTVRLQRCCG